MKWRGTLESHNLENVATIVSLSDEQFDFPAQVWAMCVIDFGVAHSEGSGSPDEIVLSMTLCTTGVLAVWPGKQFK